MKIAIISTIRKSWGGSEELWAAFANYALDQGHQVVLSAFNCGRISSKVQDLVNKGMDIDWRIGQISNSTSFLKKLSLRTTRIFRKTVGNPFNNLFKHNPDIVLYVGTAYSIAEDHKLLKLIQKNSTLLFLNVQLNQEYSPGLLNQTEQILIQNGYRQARNIFFVSERNKVAASKQLNMEFSNAVVVRNPVNIDNLDALPFPSSSVVNMAMVGNLITIHKGQEIAISVLSKEPWIGRNWHLNIYGEGTDQTMLENLLIKTQLCSRVTFHGAVSNIREIWSNNHILLMPSRMEGMPLAVVEAMICGRPSVVTDVGGHREWIEDGREGWIASEVSEESFNLAMEKAWTNNGVWEEVGLLAHKKALSLYDPHPGKTLFELIQNSIKN